MAFEQEHSTITQEDIMAVVLSDSFQAAVDRKVRKVLVDLGVINADGTMRMAPPDRYSVVNKKKISAKQAMAMEKGWVSARDLMQDTGLAAYKLPRLRHIGLLESPVPGYFTSESVARLKERLSSGEPMVNDAELAARARKNIPPGWSIQQDLSKSLGIDHGTLSTRIHDFGLPKRRHLDGLGRTVTIVEIAAIERHLEQFPLRPNKRRRDRTTP